MSSGSDNNCVLCGQKNLVAVMSVYDNRFGAPGDYTISRCNSCGLLQTLPRLSEPALIAIYKRYYNFGSGKSPYAGLRETLFRSWIYRIWLMIDGDITFQLSKGRGRLLDVGCNEGRGLDQFRRSGFIAEGQEPNSIAADQARARGFSVSTSPLSEFRTDNVFDVIVLSNVLEHAIDPRGMLENIARLLRVGGEVWISLPNVESIWRRVFGRQWINWHVPYHIAHFSQRHLTRLLASVGLKIVDCRNETPTLWIAQSIIATFFAHPGTPTRALRSIALVAPIIVLMRVLLFPILWYFNKTGRGDALVLRARKA